MGSTGRSAERRVSTVTACCLPCLAWRVSYAECCKAVALDIVVQTVTGSTARAGKRAGGGAGIDKASR